MDGFVDGSAFNSINHCIQNQTKYACTN